MRAQYPYLLFSGILVLPIIQLFHEGVELPTGKNRCIPHFVKIVELLWKPVISTVFPHCGIVFFHSNSIHSILYSDQSVEILWKFLAYLQSVENVEFLWKFCGVNIVESVSSFVSVENYESFVGLINIDEISSYSDWFLIIVK